MADKIINKLNEIKSKLEELKETKPSEGGDELFEIYNSLDRFIDRIYPENQAKNLKSKLHGDSFMKGYFTGNNIQPPEHQAYIPSIKRAIRIINTILEEYETFGFDDFQPVKEKTETTIGIDKGKPSLLRKKTY